MDRPRPRTVSYTTAAQAFGAAKPIAAYSGADGERVQFLHAPQIDCNCPAPYISEKDLVFQFGTWLVQVDASSLTDQQRATWARSLTGTIDTGGYLVLHARAPLALGNQFDGGFGPIDVRDFVRLTTHSDNRQGQLTCGPGQSDTNAHRRRTIAANGWHGFSWCVGSDLHIAIGGSSGYVDLANEELRINSL